jgi:hypothetical protein
MEIMQTKAVPGSVTLVYEIHAVDPESGVAGVEFRVSGGSFGGGTWQPAELTTPTTGGGEYTATIAGLSYEDSYIVEFRATNTDGASGIIPDSNNPIYPVYASLSGNVWAESTPTSSSGAAAGVEFRPTILSTVSITPDTPVPTSGTALEAGGYVLPTAWALRAGTSTPPTGPGTANYTVDSLHILTDTHWWSSDSGTLEATLDASNAITELGFQGGLQPVPLIHKATGTIPDLSPQYILGGWSTDSPWYNPNPSPPHHPIAFLAALGAVPSPATWHAEIDGTVLLDDGDYAGDMAGWLAQRTDGQYNLSGRIVAVYVDPDGKAGILTGGFGEGAEANVLSSVNMVDAQGGFQQAVVLEPSSGLSTISLDTVHSSTASGTGTLGTNGTITASSVSTTLKQADFFPWGVGSLDVSGTYTPGSLTFPADAVLSQQSLGGLDIAAGIVTAQFSSESSKSAGTLQNVIEGTAAAGFVVVDGSSVSTGIFVGETIGTFNPSASPDPTWTATAIGPWMETTAYLDLVSSNPSVLTALNLPAYEVGTTTLSGAGTNYNVALNNIKFLAPTSGGLPTVWATGSVTGAFTGIPSETISLSNGQLAVQFTPTHWSGNQWAATVSGSELNGDLGAFIVDQMHGVAAGTYSGDPSGTFSGTAAGAVQAHNH